MTKAKLQEFEGSVISIILPTRGRTGGALQASLASLLDNADDCSRIEIMLGVMMTIKKLLIGSITKPVSLLNNTAVHVRQKYSNR